MATNQQPGLARRAGTMFVLLVTRSTDAMSLLFTAALPVGLTAVAVAETSGAILFSVALLGWSADFGSRAARDIYENGYFVEDADQSDWTPDWRSLLALAAYVNVTLGYTTLVAAALLPVGTGVALAAAMLLPATDSWLSTRRWYLSPGVLVVESALRAVGGRQLLRRALASPLVTDLDVKTILSPRRQH